MPVKIPSSLPAVEILKAENIFVMDDLRASAQDIPPHLQHAFTNRTRFYERFGTHLPEYSARTYRYIL